MVKMETFILCVFYIIFKILKSKRAWLRLENCIFLCDWSKEFGVHRDQLKWPYGLNVKCPPQTHVLNDWFPAGGTILGGGA
jgi:hypothetical protein